ncbi:hypothetical protein AVMA1855_01990 [Acidovorax sp. SUPP1855]|uniref:hypothetical protein n=1 Tax=Acidovorax sp. SUPP1855 TaxID=431774 RepID=UPI0023DE5C2F|nr:hypothetical protein [Acidovorax sp. SUPP1855]GKS82872.1 hypothetical protein AVMA1855_01990 [Acidovorax sp. SUPP1855]
MTYSKRAKIFLFGVLGLIAAFLLFLIFAWSTFDVSEAGRHSMAYQLAAPGHLRDVEIIGECRPPKYRWKGRDGMGVPFSSLNYCSSAPTTDIFKIYRQAFASHSCKIETSIPESKSGSLLILFCDSQNFSSIQIFIADNSKCSDIVISFIGNN